MDEIAGTLLTPANVEEFGHAVLELLGGGGVRFSHQTNDGRPKTGLKLKRLEIEEMYGILVVLLDMTRRQSNAFPIYDESYPLGRVSLDSMGGATKVYYMFAVGELSAKYCRSDDELLNRQQFVVEL